MIPLLDVKPPTTGPLGEVTFNFHPGQLQAMNSRKAIVLVLAGVRGGKTSTGPPWLFREMRRKGRGDYLVAAPSLKLLDKAAVPELEHVLGRVLKLGTMTTHPFQFKISREGEGLLWGDYQERPTRIVFGHADDPESLAAMQAKAAWLDEAGQGQFKLSSFEEVRVRLSIDRGRCLLTTTVYNLGWLKQKIYDPWINANKQHPEIDVIRFDSIMNPAFPREEWERARRDLPAWRFNMRHRGFFERPAGLIYDCFDPAKHVWPAFTPGALWPRFAGIDFGGVNTAALFLASELDAGNMPTGRHFLYREYLSGGRTAKEHVAELTRGEPRLPLFVGGAGSEDQWRQEFAAAGLPVLEPPIREVEVGILRCYAAIKSGRLLIMDNLAGLLDELGSYSRELDEAGNPTEKIEAQHSYHRLDAARYLMAHLWRDDAGAWDVTEQDEQKNPMSEAPKGVFL